MVIKNSKKRLRNRDVKENCQTIWQRLKKFVRIAHLLRGFGKSALDFYQSIDEDFEQVEWKSASLLGAPRSYEILKTRKSEMLKKPPFAATIVYIACKMCDATHSIEKILQKFAIQRR